MLRCPGFGQFTAVVWGWSSIGFAVEPQWIFLTASWILVLRSRSRHNPVWTWVFRAIYSIRSSVAGEDALINIYQMCVTLPRTCQRVPRRTARAGTNMAWVMIKSWWRQRWTLTDNIPFINTLRAQLSWYSQVIDVYHGSALVFSFLLLDQNF